MAEFFDLNELLMENSRLLQRYHRTMHPPKSMEIDPRQGQGRILAVLKNGDGITQKEIAYILGIRQQTVGEMLGKLEKSGYVVRERSQADRRALLIRLTEKGQELELMKEADPYAFPCLEESEKEMLQSLLTRIAEDLRSRMSGEEGPEDGWFPEEFGPEGPMGPMGPGGPGGMGRPGCPPPFGMEAGKGPKKGRGIPFLRPKQEPFDREERGPKAGPRPKGPRGPQMDGPMGPGNDRQGRPDRPMRMEEGGERPMRPDRPRPHRPGEPVRPGEHRGPRPERPVRPGQAGPQGPQGPEGMFPEEPKPEA